MGGTSEGSLGESQTSFKKWLDGRTSRLSKGRTDGLRLPNYFELITARVWFVDGL